jgi:hypothetical protein
VISFTAGIKKKKGALRAIEKKRSTKEQKRSKHAAALPGLICHHDFLVRDLLLARKNLLEFFAPAACRIDSLICMPTR